MPLERKAQDKCKPSHIIRAFIGQRYMVLEKVGEEDYKRVQVVSDEQRCQKLSI